MSVNHPAIVQSVSEDPFKADMASLRSEICNLKQIVNSLQAAQQSKTIKIPLKSLVKLDVDKAAYNFRYVWQPRVKKSRSRGSGCVVLWHGEKHILTNAHVVRNQRQIRVRFAKDTENFLATVVQYDPLRDLALLKVAEPAFHAHAEPLALGEAILAKGELDVMGFPIGGRDLSVTHGVISRVETVKGPNRFPQLTIQTDAPINPGNSGGPALVNNKIVGLAFSGLDDADNIGYLIPVCSIRHFLSCSPSKPFAGVPNLFFRTQDLDNEALREHLGVGITRATTGVRVTTVAETSVAYGKLLPNDVITHLDGHAISNLGTYNPPENKQVNASFRHLFSQKKLGDRVKVALHRNGQPITVTLQLGKRWGELDLMPPLHTIAKPEYYIASGMVFTPLTEDYIDDNEIHLGEGQVLVTPSIRKLKQHRNQYQTKAKRQVVLLSRILPSQYSKGYEDFKHLEVTMINGQPIGSMHDVVAAIQANRAAGHVVTFSNDDILVIKNLTAAEESQVLVDNDVQAAYSDNLQSVVAQYQPVTVPAKLRVVG